MITIQKGETKKVIFTLNEKGVDKKTSPIYSGDVYYIFDLKSNDNRVNTVFTALDTSLSKNRYNSFTFSEGVTATMSGGFVLDVGSYDYTVYVTDVANSIVTTTASVVETGLFKVTGTASNYDTYNGGDNREYVYIS